MLGGKYLSQSEKKEKRKRKKQKQAKHLNGDKIK